MPRYVLEEERWLLSQGILHGEMRDEIYCQVMKQLSGNPSTYVSFLPSLCSSALLTRTCVQGKCVQGLAVALRLTSHVPPAEELPGLSAFVSPSGDKSARRQGRRDGEVLLTTVG